MTLCSIILVINSSQNIGIHDPKFKYSKFLIEI